jgi:hypothetical protein
MSEERDTKRFDEICERIDDHEPLPTVVARPRENPAELSDEERTAPLDELILAGLVSPY